MEAVMVILAIVFFWVLIWCARKEKTLSGFYSSINVCGRGRAFFAGYLFLTSVISVISLVVTLVSLIFSKGQGSFADGIGSILGVVICGAVCFLISRTLYRGIYNNCPEELRKRLPKDILIITMGITFRISLFFLMFIFHMWWQMNKPTAYEVDGRTVYAYPGSNDLYDESGNHVGTTNSDRTSAVMD